MANGVVMTAAVCFLLVGVRLVAADLNPKNIEISVCQGEEAVFVPDNGNMAQYQLERGGIPVVKKSLRAPVVIEDNEFFVEDRIALRHADAKFAGQYDMPVVYTNGTTQHVTFRLNVEKDCPEAKRMQAPAVSFSNTSGYMLPLPESKKILVDSGPSLIFSVLIPMADPPVVADITMPEYNITMEGSPRSDCLKEVPVDTRKIGVQKISIFFAYKSHYGSISRNSTTDIKVQVGESLMTTPPTREMTSLEPQSDSSWGLMGFIVGLILLAFQLKTAIFEHRIWRDRNSGQTEEVPNAEMKEEIPMNPGTSNEVNDAKDETAVYIGEPPAPRQATDPHDVVTNKAKKTAGPCTTSTDDGTVHARPETEGLLSGQQ